MKNVIVKKKVRKLKMKNLILKAITTVDVLALFVWVLSLDSVFELPYWVAVVGFGWLYFFGWANDWFEEKKKVPARCETITRTTFKKSSFIFYILKFNKSSFRRNKNECKN